MSFLYLTTKGWKSGKPHEIEIWYVEYEECFYIVSEMRGRAHWIQNIQHNPRAQFSVGKKKFQGTGRILDPERDAELVSIVSKIMGEKYGWSEGTIVELRPD